MLRFLKNTEFLLICALAIFCFYQTTAAQSGRRVTKVESPAQENTPVESKSTKIESLPDEAPVRISSLIVVGEVQHNFQYYKSNQIDAALKECVRMLKSSSKPLSQVTRGSGKIDYKEAKEIAEKETDIFVLWLGFSAKDDGYGNMYIDTVLYSVLTPKTAKVVTRGEIDPAENKVVTSAGVLQIPTNRRNSPTTLTQMLQGARKIADILRRGGWLD